MQIEQTTARKKYNVFILDKFQKCINRYNCAAYSRFNQCTEIANFCKLYISVSVCDIWYMIYALTPVMDCLSLQSVPCVPAVGEFAAVVELSGLKQVRKAQPVRKMRTINNTQKKNKIVMNK